MAVTSATYTPDTTFTASTGERDEPNSRSGTGYTTGGRTLTADHGHVRFCLDLEVPDSITVTSPGRSPRREDVPLHRDLQEPRRIALVAGELLLR